MPFPFVEQNILTNFSLNNPIFFSSNFALLALLAATVSLLGDQQIIPALLTTTLVNPCRQMRFADVLAKSSGFLLLFQLRINFYSHSVESFFLIFYCLFEKIVVHNGRLISPCMKRLSPPKEQAYIVGDTAVLKDLSDLIKSEIRRANFTLLNSF